MPAHGLPSIRERVANHPGGAYTFAGHLPAGAQDGREIGQDASCASCAGAHRVRRVEVGRHQGAAWSAVTARMSRWGVVAGQFPEA